MQEQKSVLQLFVNAIPLDYPHTKTMYELDSEWININNSVNKIDSGSVNVLKCMNNQKVGVVIGTIFGNLTFYTSSEENLNYTTCIFPEELGKFLPGLYDMPPDEELIKQCIGDVIDEEPVGNVGHLLNLIDLSENETIEDALQTFNSSEIDPWDIVRKLIEKNVSVGKHSEDEHLMHLRLDLLDDDEKEIVLLSWNKVNPTKAVISLRGVTTVIKHSEVKEIDDIIKFLKETDALIDIVSSKINIIARSLISGYGSEITHA